MNKEDDNILISFSDFTTICRRSKKKFIYGMLLCSLFAVCYGLLVPPQYIANATFKERTKSSTSTFNIGNLLGNNLLGGQSSDRNSEAAMMMKSRKLLTQVIEKLGLQVTVQKAGISFPRLATTGKNLKLEYYRLIGKKAILPNKIPAFELVNVKFAGETAAVLSLQFTTDSMFEVTNAEGHMITGHADTPFTIDNITFTINKTSADSLIGTKYNIGFSTLPDTIEALNADIIITSGRDEKTLLKLEYKNVDRYKAIKVLDTVMSVFQNYLEYQEERILTRQLIYLHSKQDEMSFKLKEMLEEHAHSVSSELKEVGFADSNRALEFLASTQHEYGKRLLRIELDLKHFQKIQSEKCYESCGLEEAVPSVVAQMIARKQHLKQQADALELALATTTLSNSKVTEEAFLARMSDRENMQKLIRSAQEMSVAINEGQLPNPSSYLFQDPSFRIKLWYDKLVEAQNNPVEWQPCCDNFGMYLTNLLHFFHLHEKALQEWLTHFQGENLEFQGIDLPLAKEIYIQYNHQLHDLEAKILQNRFNIDQMQDPNFEISSLSTVLYDGVAQEIVRKASSLIYELKDENNRSAKEQERKKSELILQKKILTMHLEQMIQVHELTQSFLKDKILALQAAMMVLIQQEDTVLHEHIVDYVKTRIDQLQHEKNILETHQQEVNQAMAKLPIKLVKERLINQQLEINRSLVEEITKLVESKNITRNLELILSAPIDSAVAPMELKSHSLIVLAALGAVIGGFCSLVFVLGRSIVTGLPATEQNLNLAGLQMCGRFSPHYDSDSNRPLLDNDLDIMRRLISFLEIPDNATSFSNINHWVLMLTGGGVNCTKDLAILLEKKGLRVVIVSLMFNDKNSNLIQYLEGKVDFPFITKGHHYDEIFAGGVDRFAYELLGTPRFDSLLNKLNETYDWIIVVSSISFKSAEGEGLVNMFPNAVVMLQNEMIQDVRDFVSHCPNTRKAFVFGY